MKREVLVLGMVLCAVALWLLPARHKVSAESHGVYNPYPPGILPSDLDAELARVAAEVNVVEARAMVRWQNLQPPTLTNQPPILANTGTEATEILGELMNYDINISPSRNRACASCHMPYVAFSGPIPSVNLTMIAYASTVNYRAAKRTAQRYTYAPFFPVLQYNEQQGLFFGGNFWDSRATGYNVRNPDAEQAQGPPWIIWRWASRIRPASSIGFRKPHTDLSSNWSMAKVPLRLAGHPTQSRSATLPEVRLATTRCRCSLVRPTELGRTMTIITGRRRWMLTSSRSRSLPSPQSSMPG